MAGDDEGRVNPRLVRLGRGTPRRSRLPGPSTRAEAAHGGWASRPGAARERPGALDVLGDQLGRSQRPELDGGDPEGGGSGRGAGCGAGLARRRRSCGRGGRKRKIRASSVGPGRRVTAARVVDSEVAEVRTMLRVGDRPVSLRKLVRTRRSSRRAPTTRGPRRRRAGIKAECLGLKLFGRWSAPR